MTRAEEALERTKRENEERIRKAEDAIRQAKQSVVYHEDRLLEARGWRALAYEQAQERKRAQEQAA